MEERSLIEFKEMDKRDLHVHLNGAIPKNTIINFINEQNISIPKNFNLETDLEIRHPVKSLRDYFLPWEVLKLLPRDYKTLHFMVGKAIELMADDNVKYVEFRNSPFYISRLNNISLNEAVSWLVNAVHYHSIKFKVDARLILSLTRHEFIKGQDNELLKAIQNANRYNIIVGVDMSGDEDYPIQEDVDVFFKKAKDEQGLNISLHAGETGNFKNIDWAINNCNADRIGHGNAAILSEYTLSLIKEKDVCIEVCLYSNLMTGSCSDIVEHPVKSFLEWEIPFVLCSDNPSIHNKLLSEEYLLYVNCFGNLDIISNMYKVTEKYSFSKGE